MKSAKTPQISDPYAGLKLPEVKDMEVQLEQLVQQGVLSPEDAEAAMAESSQMNGISTDPRLKQAQMDALLGLQDVSEGGLTDSDEAGLNKIRNQELTTAKGARDAIIQGAQSRGLGGSGLELMAQMQNQQDSATRTSQRDMDIAGQASDRALQALIEGGNLGGKIQAQDFDQQAQVAGANDAIAKFNAANKQNVNLANTQARNTAQATNLGMKQSIADQNVNTRNTQQTTNKNLIQQNFDNEIKKRGGSANVAQANQAAAGANSQSSANANNQLVGGLLGAGSAVGSAYIGKEDGGLVEGQPTEGDSVPHLLQPGEMVIRKDDVPNMLAKAHTDDKGEFDAAGFLDSITGHKYGYSKKGKKNDE